MDASSASGSLSGLHCGPRPTVPCIVSSLAGARRASAVLAVASLPFDLLADILKADDMHARHLAQLSRDKPWVDRTINRFPRARSNCKGRSKSPSPLTNMARS